MIKLRRKFKECFRVLRFFAAKTGGKISTYPKPCVSISDICHFPSFPKAKSQFPKFPGVSAQSGWVCKHRQGPWRQKSLNGTVVVQVLCFRYLLGVVSSHAIFEIFSWRFAVKILSKSMTAWKKGILPSLKLTFSHLKMDGWNTIVSCWVSASFQGRKC